MLKEIIEGTSGVYLDDEFPNCLFNKEGYFISKENTKISMGSWAVRIDKGDLIKIENYGEYSYIYKYRPDIEDWYGILYNKDPERYRWIDVCQQYRKLNLQFVSSSMNKKVKDIIAGFDNRRVFKTVKGAIDFLSNLSNKPKKIEINIIS